jgi:hypothetical protein
MKPYASCQVGWMLEIEPVVVFVSLEAQCHEMQA